MQRNHKNTGFTLVELLIVAPIVLLVIAGLVGTIIAITGNTLATRGYNKLVYDVNEAISMIEKDINNSQAIVKNSIYPTLPQGKDGATEKFDTDNETLVIKSYATSASPIDKDKSVIFTKVDTNCANGGDEAVNLNIVYFLDNDKTLWRRTIVPDNYLNNGYCNHNKKEVGQPWQLPTCEQNDISKGICKAEDVKLLENVTELKFQDSGKTLFSDSSSNCGTPLSEDIFTMTIDIKAKRKVAGRDLSYQASLGVDTKCQQ